MGGLYDEVVARRELANREGEPGAAVAARAKVHVLVARGHSHLSPQILRLGLGESVASELEDHASTTGHLPAQDCCRAGADNLDLFGRGWLGVEVPVDRGEQWVGRYFVLARRTRWDK